MSDKLKKTIDKMVEDSIRRILPSVMNEVLLQTIANANVIREAREPAPVRRAMPAPQKARRPSSLDALLDPEAGADFYNDPRAALAEAQEEPQPRGQVIAQRIQNLPPQFQQLAEGMDLDDDGGEMWESDVGDSSPVVSSGPGPSLRQGQAAGLDFSLMKKFIPTEAKRNPGPDAAAKAQYEESRLKALRERLEKPV